MSSGQVKSCLLLSGLFASGPTTVYEPLASRDHTERMLSALGLSIEAAGTMIRLQPPREPDAIPAFDITLPGDLSSAAFIACAAQIVPGSHVTLRETNLNPTRAGILDVIRLLGGNATTRPMSETLGEPVGELTVKAAELRGGTISGEVAIRSIDEIPIACALAARARGTTTFADVGDLRVKESNRIAVMVEVLRAFGIDAQEEETGLSMEGRPEAPLRAATVTSHGDHRVAMTAVVLALLADGESVVEDVDCIATSFPRFVGTLRALGADIEVSQ
jgi:3-phosphoshikimate 1-carboxyvinyltransferase